MLCNPGSAGEARRRWALEGATNPAVLRLHVDAELTTRTIETCPPEEPPPLLEPLLNVDGLRSMDLHRYRARLNLEPGAEARIVAGRVSETIVGRWGEAVELPSDEGPKAFQSAGQGPRCVAESREMAVRSRDARLLALFNVDGVAEAIAGEGLVLVRLGRLFAWDERMREQVGEAVATAS